MKPTLADDLREIWRAFPPWLKTFLIGLAVAIAAPTLIALENLDAATDWRVWFGSLTAAVGLSVLHYVKDVLRFSLTQAMAGGGLALGAGAVAVTLLALGGANQAGVTVPLVTEGEISLNLPASPVEVQLSDVACNAESVEKAVVSSGLPPIYTYTLKHTTRAGSSVFLRWTDAPGMLGQNAVVEVNGQSAHPEPDERTKKCLRERATAAPSTGGPR